MTNYKLGDIVLVDFGFTEGSGSKRRPALIISSEHYHKDRHEVIVAALTTNTERVLFGDTKIEQWKEAGLIYPSVVTGIIRTVNINVVIQKFGMLLKQDLQKVQANLRRAIEL